MARCFIAWVAVCALGLTAGASSAAAQGGPREACRSGSPDAAIAACSQLLKQSPRDASLHNDRCKAYLDKSQHDRAIADCDEAIRLNAGYAAYFNRGLAYKKTGDVDRAIADYANAIKLNPTYAPSYLNRGVAFLGKGDYDRAIADFDEALKLNTTYDLAYFNRGLAYEKKSNRTKAIEDYSKVLAAPAKSQFEQQTQAEARARLAELKATPTLSVTPQKLAKAPGDDRLFSGPDIAPPDRRVALVIGNAAYAAVGALANARKDARDVAAALRDAGFAQVVEHYDLKIEAMRKALSAFEDLAKTADWAVVYYAGHGLEVGGQNYLVAVDAQLNRASDVEDETVPLERLLTRVSGARKLQLVILDACRDNPYAKRMTRSVGLSRSIGTRGLARVETSALPNLMIAYAAAKGEAALDGPPGRNSPYAKALVKYLAEPQLELGMFFRKVRADVMADTNSRQRPFEDSSLTDVGLFFRQAAK